MELIMKNRIFFTLFIIVILQVIFSDVFAQVRHVKVDKMKCWHERDKVDGYKLVVIIEYKDTIITTSEDYDLVQLTGLPDSTKLTIVEQLLKFKNDLSVCCRKVYKYYFEGIERTCIGKPQSQTFSIQIDALYMINKIVHPYGTSMYSCYPVIIDWKSKAEINNCPDLVADYYKVYEKRLKECLRTKMIGDTFQFNTTKYAWFGADPNTINEQ